MSSKNPVKYLPLYKTLYSVYSTQVDVSSILSIIIQLISDSISISVTEICFKGPS